MPGRESIVTCIAAIAAVTFATLCPIISSPVRAGPLHDAAKEGDLARIEQLLDQGADINKRAGGATALHYAILKGHINAAELLIQRGADINATSSLGTPLYFAASGGRTEIARLLLERGADVNAGKRAQSPLHAAAGLGRTEFARLLLDHGADVNALTEGDEPALHLAIVRGHAETADLLKKRGTSAPQVEKIGGLLASADPTRGKDLASRCIGCHALKQSGPLMKGPPLWDIVGRTKASFAKFQYSPALQAAGGEWTYEALNSFLAHPAWTIPGTSMVLQGIHNPRDRADLIGFLRTLSNNPVALP
jgi:cytochrome c